MKIQTCAYVILTVVCLVACDNNGSAGSGGAVHYGYKGGPQQQSQAGACKDPSKPCTNNPAAKDITTLSEYQKTVAPIGQSIASLNQFAMPDEDVTSSTPSRMTDFFQNFAKMKTWNFISTSVDQLSPSILKAALAQGQITVQTATDVFIDATQYNSLSEADRGQLLLHELLVEIYLDQYSKSTDLLNQMAAVEPTVKMDKSVVRASAEDAADKIDPVMPPLTETLSSDDMSKIRTFRTFLISGATKLTSDNLYTAVKAAFPRVSLLGPAGFARPYQYKHANQ